MNSIQKQNGNFLLYVTIILLLVSMLVFPTEVAKGGLASLRLCVATVIPTIFPFLVASYMFTHSNLAKKVSELFAPFLRFVFKLPPICSIPFILGIISGYPVGGSVNYSLMEEGKLSKQVSERLMPFCNNAGPTFIIGGVGSVMLGNPEMGFLLYFVHIISALLCAFIYFSLFPCKNKESFLLPPQKEKSFSLLLTNGVKSSVITILNICGFILFFGVVIEILKASMIISDIARFVCVIMPFLDFDVVYPMLIGIIEMTTGVNECVMLLPLPIALIIIEMLISFGGFSVYFQVSSLINREDFSLAPYFFGKVATSLLSGVIMFIFLHFTGFSAPVFARANINPSVFDHPYQMLFSYMGVFFVFALFVFVPLFVCDCIEFGKCKRPCSRK